MRVSDGRIDLGALGPEGPSATWTYLVNDDPFRHQIGSLLTGAGGATVAIYSAWMVTPLLLLLLWGTVDRFVKSRLRRPPAGR